MSKLVTNTVRHTAGSADNITLDNSKNVTCENNLQVDGALTVTGAINGSGASLTNLPSSPPAGRNILINGDMRIAQRATSSTDQGCKTTDRFYYDKGGTNETPQQEQRALTSSDTGPWAKGFRWCYKITNGNQSALDATDYVRFKYITENRDIHQSGWEYTDPNSKVTISFWVKSSVSQRFYFALRTSEGTGQHYAHPFTPAANTWTYVTHTIPGNANNVFGDNNGHGLMLQWQLAIGSSYTDDSFTDDAWGVYQTNQFKDYNDGDNDWYETDNATWEITGVQFEAGDTATDFEFKRHDDELRRCQRYYQVKGGYGGLCASASVAYLGGSLNPTMRATPTIGQTAALAVNDNNVNSTQSSTGLASADANDDGFFIAASNFPSNLTSNNPCLMKIAGKLTFSAEF